MRLLLCILAMTVGLTGCAMNWKTVRERQLEVEAQQLKGRLTEAEQARKELLRSQDKMQEELARLQDERAREIQRLTEEKHLAAQEAAREKEEEAQDLVRAKEQLAQSLQKELGDARAKLAMTERGLVLTFLDEIFFDSGKAQVKPDGLETLQKVAQVLKETVPDSPVAVEGHTDNEPIRYSSWRSNWELSSARALAVVHFFIQDEGIDPKRLRGVGYGEHQPVASNETAEGRRQNRRVEVVILPKLLTKVKSPS